MQRPLNREARGLLARADSTVDSALAIRRSQFVKDIGALHGDAVLGGSYNGSPHRQGARERAASADIDTALDAVFRDRVERASRFVARRLASIGRMLTGK